MKNADAEQAAPARKSSPDGPMGTASGCVCVHLAWADGSSGSQSFCMHSEELQTAATKGDTKTVVALLARGEDVHCKGTDGYGSRAASSGRYFGTVSGRTVRPRVELQVCLFGCAGGRRCTGRRIMATQRRRRPWSRQARTCAARTTQGTVARAASWCRWFATVLGGRSVHAGWSCRCSCLGCAEGRRCSGRRRMATQRRRWRCFWRTWALFARARMGTILGLHRGTAASPSFAGSAQREGHGSRRVELWAYVSCAWRWVAR